MVILVAVWANAELSALFQNKKDAKSSSNELAQDMESPQVRNTGSVVVSAALFPLCLDTFPLFTKICAQTSSPMKNASGGGDIVPDAFKSTSSIDWNQMTFYTKVLRLDKQALIQSLPTLRAM